MSRIGWSIFCVLLVAGAVWLWWPEPGTGTGVRLVPRSPPKVFVLETPDLIQRVGPDGVDLDGTVLNRPASAHKIGDFWSSIHRITATGERKRVDEAQLPAYGIDGSWRLHSDDPPIDLRWGRKSGLSYVWSGTDKTLYPFDKHLVDYLADRAVRLDSSRLVPGITRGAIVRAEVGEHSLRLIDRRWIDARRLERPHLTGRMSRLLLMLSRLELRDLHGSLPEEAAPVFEIQIQDRGGGTVDYAFHEVDDGGEKRGWVMHPGLPPQPLPEGTWRDLRHAVGLLDKDFLLDERKLYGGDVLQRVVVERGGEPWFTVRERRLTEQMGEGELDWDLIWEDGREVAAPDIGAAFERVLRSLELASIASDPRSHAEIAAGEDVITIRATGVYLEGRTLTVHLEGGLEVSNGEQRGELVRMPPLLEALGPDAMLDTALLTVDPDRIGKFQRARHDGDAVDAEVYRKAGTGDWQQSHPERLSADRMAIMRILRLLTAGRATAAHLADDGDRAILAGYDREIAVRIEAADWNQRERLELDERGRRDWGLFLARRDGRWRAVNVDGTLSYDLDDDLVEGLFAPVLDRLAFPIVPSLVMRLRVDPRDGEPYWLIPEDHRGARWRVQQGEERAPADTAQVRRYLQNLARLVADKVDMDSPSLGPDRVEGSITAELPGIEQALENLELLVGARRADGTEASPVSDDASGAILPGRIILSTDPGFELLPPRERFLAVDDG